MLIILRHYRSSSSVIAPLVALLAVASIIRRGFGQIPINWIILDLFGNMMIFDVFIIYEIFLYLYKYECIILIHCASCTASRHRSRLRRQTLKINLLGIISEETTRWIWWKQVVQTSPALPWFRCLGGDEWCFSLSSGLNHTPGWIRQKMEV